MEGDDREALIGKILGCKQENQRISWKMAEEVTQFSQNALRRIYYSYLRKNRQREPIVHKWTKEEEERLAMLCGEQCGRVRWNYVQQHFPELSVGKLKNKMSQIMKNRNEEEEQRAIRDLNAILDKM